MVDWLESNLPSYNRLLLLLVHPRPSTNASALFSKPQTNDVLFSTISPSHFVLLYNSKQFRFRGHAA